MALSPGTTIGHYDVTALLGEGGMGQVWQATDTQLNRQVALKILPDAFAADPDRLARFKREAQILASLNHPNIAAIYGIEEAEGTRALVLELVEGPTLADRISKGPIPLDEALPIAKQIAEALEAAHEAGVIHRDLKPANIKVREDGTVKVLDFGLAKALDTAREGDPSQSPTLTAAATQMGVIMGTAGYMSPEQARGGIADRRSDIWSFGVVLLEMLTGRPAFTGTTVSDTLAFVLTKEPDWAALPRFTPDPLRRLLRRCLKKEPTQRLGYIGDARLDIEDARTEPAAVVAPSVPQPVGWRRVVPLVLGSLLVGGSVIGAAVWSLMSASPSPTSRFAIHLPSTDRLPPNPGPAVALSDDGRTLVYAAIRDDDQRLYVRRLNQLEARPIPGTEGGQDVFLSPDGEWVGFQADGELKKVALAGGAPLALCEVDGAPAGASWWGDTVIFGGSRLMGLSRVSAAGGIPEPITEPDADQGEGAHFWPEILPGGHAVLFTIGYGPNAANNRIAVHSLETGNQHVLLDGTRPRYLPTGHLIFARADVLWAVPFDAQRLEVTGSPAPVLEGISVTPRGAAQFTTTRDGSLVYVPDAVAGGSARYSFVWVDREGREDPVAAEPRAYRYPRLSSDGTKVAVDVTDQKEDIWVWEFARQTLTRVTVDASRDIYSLWTPDGQRVVFASYREGFAKLFWKAADGTGSAEPLVDHPNSLRPMAFSPDGRRLVAREGHPEEAANLVVLSMDGERTVEPLLATDFDERNAEVSPDGRWLAYDSNSSGEWEVYVRPFPNVDQGLVLVSRNGGVQPLWAPDGRELFYRGPEGGLIAVSVQTEPDFTASIPEVVFEGPYLVETGRNYDLHPDGQRFLMVKEGTGTEAATQLHVVQHWFEELQRLVPIP